MDGPQPGTPTHTQVPAGHTHTLTQGRNILLVISSQAITCWKQSAGAASPPAGGGGGPLRPGRIRWKPSGIAFRSTSEEHPVNRCGTLQIETDAEQRRPRGDGPRQRVLAPSQPAALDDGLQD